MVKSFKKRIILGFVIVLTLFLFTNVHAEPISSISTSGLSQRVSNTSTSIQYDIGQGNWANWGSGYFYYSFSLVKISDTSTDYVVFPSFASVSSGGHEFICEIGSVSVNNSTRNGQTYSAKCPMTSYGDGVVRLRVRLFDYGVHPNNPMYEIHINGLLSFEKANSSQVNVDMSSVTQQQQQTNQYLHDQIIDIQNNTREIEKTNRFIKDDSVDNSKVNDTIDSAKSKLASNGSITQLLTLPIQMYQNILNSVSGSCSSFSFGSLYNHNLTLPCINLKNLLGSTLYGIIDILISGLFILSFRKKMVDIFNHMSSLNDRGNEIE